MNTYQDIPGTVEQKFSLMLLERIDRLTDELERTKQELVKTKERLPPDIPDDVTLKDPYERSNVYFMRLNVKIQGDIVSIVKKLPYVDYVCHYTCETRNLLSVNEDNDQSVNPDSDHSVYYYHNAKYSRSTPYHEPNISGWTIQMIVYLKQHEYISRLAVDVWDKVFEDVVNIRYWDVPKFYIRSIPANLRAYYECLTMASQLKRNVWDIDFIDPDVEIECESSKGKTWCRPSFPVKYEGYDNIWKRYHEDLVYEEDLTYDDWFFTEFEVLR